jgi:hypothetical protein
MIASTGSQHLSITTAPVAFVVSRIRPLFASIAGESSLYIAGVIPILRVQKESDKMDSGKFAPLQSECRRAYRKLT